MYVGDPGRVVKNAVRHLAPGGVVAWQELSLSPNSLHVEPGVPLWDQVWEWVCTAAERAHIETSMGYRTRNALQAAGLADPTMQLTASVGSGPDDAIYDFAAETVRSLLPMIIETGVATATEVDVDTLGERLRHATLASDSCVKDPDLVAVWARTDG